MVDRQLKLFTYTHYCRQLLSLTLLLLGSEGSVALGVSGLRLGGQVREVLSIGNGLVLLGVQHNVVRLVDLAERHQTTAHIDHHVVGVKVLEVLLAQWLVTKVELLLFGFVVGHETIVKGVNGKDNN